MHAKTLASTLLISAVVMGCAGPGRRSRPTRPVGLVTTARTVADGLHDVLARKDDRATVAWVKATLPSLRDERTRALCEHAAARAQAALGRHLTALSGYQRAWLLLAGDLDGLGATVLEDWADELLRGRQARAARAHYRQLLSSPGLATARRQRLTAALVLACEASGDPGAAARWRGRLGADSVRLVLAARDRLAPLRPDPLLARAPAPVRTSQPIPGDSRRILPGLHLRRQWSARPIAANHGPMTTIRAITVHHSAMAAPAPGEAAAQIRSIQADHQQTRGWADIGYHFLIDPQGGVWEGRQLLNQGAHAGSNAPGLNVGNIGVCLLGNFERGPVPAAQQAALRDVLDALTAWFALPRDAVHTHDHYKPSTLCPGAWLKPIVARYRGEALATRSRQ